MSGYLSPFLKQVKLLPIARSQELAQDTVQGRSKRTLADPKLSSIIDAPFASLLLDSERDFPCRSMALPFPVPIMLVCTEIRLLLH